VVAECPVMATCSSDQEIRHRRHVNIFGVFLYIEQYDTLYKDQLRHRIKSVINDSTIIARTPIPFHNMILGGLSCVSIFSKERIPFKIYKLYTLIVTIS
jgi:hypothetical protein